MFLIAAQFQGGMIKAQGESVSVDGKLYGKDSILRLLRDSYWLGNEVDKLIHSKPWINLIIVSPRASFFNTQPELGVRTVDKMHLLDILKGGNHPNAVNVQVWEQRELIHNSLKAPLARLLNLPNSLQDKSSG
jgi:hypothetical protein